jgi:fatty-acyl-CoA synthase
MNLPDWIARNAGLTPDKAAIRFPGRELSYAAFAALVGRTASALAASGVRRGGCVAYLGLNSPEMLALLFASARLGAMFMPLNWRLAAPEHRQMLEDCPPALLFVEPQYVTQTETFRGALGATTLVSFGAAGSGWIAWPEFCARARGPAPRDAQPVADAPQEVPLGDAPLLICYTSGSTGKPKGVLLTQRALECNAANSADMHELTADDVILTTLPLFHVGGLNNQTTPALEAGCTVVLHPKFDPDATFDAIEQDGITLTVLVPAQLDMMMAHRRWAGADFSGLRMITTGSTIVPRHVIHAVHAKGVPLVQVYGSTETCPIAVYLKAEDAMRKPGSTGRVAARCQLRILDSQGADVKPGATGEIVVAVVVPRADRHLTAAQVLQLLDGRIARYKHPKEVVIVDALPKTALGKIRKEDVRQMVARASSPQST